MEVISASDLARRVDQDKRRRLENLSDRINRQNARNSSSSSATGSEVFTDRDGAGGSGSQVDRGSGGKARKNRQSVGSSRMPSKRKKGGSTGSGRAGRNSAAKKGKAGAAGRCMPTSQIFPKSDWPVGYSAKQVDQLSPELVVKLKQMRQKESEKTSGKELPGYKMVDQEVVIPSEYVLGGDDDCAAIFCDGRWKRFPVSEIKVWWGRIPLEWKTIMPEYGHEERGMDNRIPRATWEGAHDRTRWWELKFWASCNASNYTKQADTKVKLLEGGEVLLKGGGRGEYKHPKSLQEVAGCLTNWRSAMARLWPWSYEAEVFCKLMEDFCYLQLAKKKGLRKRIELIEKCFADCSRINAYAAHKPPMTYTQVRGVLSGILVAANVPDYTPVASLAYEELEWGYNEEAEKKHFGDGGGQRGGGRGRGFNGGRGGGGRGGGGHGRGGGASGRGGSHQSGAFSGNAPARSNANLDRVGRFSG